MELNQLPDELFHVLFSYFDVSTLLTNCAMVCKRWRELIHQMRFKELHFEPTVGPFSSYSVETTFTNFWDHSPVLLDPRYSIRTNRRCFDFSFIKIIENVKRLNLYHNLFEATHFSKLNQLSALEELQCFIPLFQQAEMTITLPRLRLLDIYFEPRNQSKLTIDSPIKVLFISCKGRFHRNSNSLNLVYPDILEEIVFFKNAHLLNFTECKNVRICRDQQELNPSDPQSGMFTPKHLETFPNLQELHYQCKFRDITLTGTPMGDLMNTAKGNISHALRRKRQENRSVKIFFQGIQLEDERFLESLELKEMSDLTALQIEHYELLTTNLNYYRKCDYNSFEKRFDDSLPANLFNKFTCVNTVTATGTIRHLNQFAAFLKQCKYLCELKVELDSLDQAFCDQLHENCFFLKKLVFKDRQKKEGGDDPANNLNAVERKLTINDRRSTFKKLNFDFLAKQMNLRSFSVDEFDMDAALRFLQISPPKLNFFSFRYFTTHISIQSKKRNSYSLGAALGFQGHTLFTMGSYQISIDELSFDLEMIKKKVNTKLALGKGFTVKHRNALFNLLVN